MESSAWQDHFRSYLPLAIAAVPTLFITIRLLGVSGYNPETAYGILQSTGTVAVIVGTTLSLVGLVVAIGAVVCFLFYQALSRKGYDYNALPGLMILTLAVTLAVTAICIAPVISLAGAGIILVWGAIRKPSQQNIIGVIIGILAATFVTAQTAQPWWPSERVEVRNYKPITAYVLSVAGQDFVVLAAKPRKIEHVNSEDVVRRTYCDTNESLLDYLYADSLMAFIINSENNYPVCPHG
jgi:hypothetical protein